MSFLLQEPNSKKELHHIFYLMVTTVKECGCSLQIKFNEEVNNLMKNGLEKPLAKKKLSAFVIEI
jgi:hypothetical protein